MKKFLTKIAAYSLVIIIFVSFTHLYDIGLETLLISYLVWIEIEKIVEKETK